MVSKGTFGVAMEGVIMDNTLLGVNICDRIYIEMVGSHSLFDVPI